MQLRRRNREDHFWDWRNRFALFPKRIGDRIIWLERYRWRHRRSEPKYLLDAAMFGTFKNHYEMETQDGYSAILTVSGMYSVPFTTRTWSHSCPELKVVGGRDT